MKRIQLLISLFVIWFSITLQAQTGTEQPTVSIEQTTITTDQPPVTPSAEQPTVTIEQPGVPVIEQSTVVTEQPVAPVDPPPVVAPEPTAPVVSESSASPVFASAAPSSKMKASAIASALKKGNILFNKKAYSDAIPYYEQALRGDNTNKLLISNLAECYRLTNNVNGQINTYGELVKSGSAEPLQQLYYGEALVENGEGEKAKEYFEKYTNDARGKELASSFNKMKMYSKNADAYNVSSVSYNSSENDFCAVKFQDAVIFSSTRTKTVWIKKQQGWTGGNYTSLYSTRDGEIPQLFMGDLDSKYNDGPVCFSKDYNTVYFTRNNSKKHEASKDGTFKLKILEATLDQNGFSMVKPLPFNDNNFNFAHPSISPDGYKLYFASDMDGGKGGMDIYVCEKDSSGNWGAPENMGDIINTAGTEAFPFIADNGTLYFSSNGHDGMGGLDIYETKMKNGLVSKIYNMGEPVNSKSDDFGMFLGEDNKTGYISSNRKANGMDDDIYALQILREVKRGKEVTITVADKLNSELLDSTKIVINGDTVMTNEKGEYLLNLDEETNYKIEAIRGEYYKLEDTVSAKSSPEDSFKKELFLEKDPKIFLRALITDAKTSELLEGVSIKLIDIATNSEVDNYVTTSAGDYFKFLYGKRMGDKLTYLLRLEKQGYLQRTVVFTHNIEKPGEINMNQMLNLTLGKVEVGMDLAKIIDIKPIYFDIGKSIIRKDAAMELDKIVQVMNEYPNMFIELGSHTDCRSSSASNLKLSTARAKSSAEYIVKRGINKMRITGKGYGETKLLNNCACEGKQQSDCPEEEHTKNRRTEFVITRLK